MPSWQYNFPYQTCRLSPGQVPIRDALQFTAASQSWHWKFQAEEPATITHVSFLQESYTGTPGTLTVGLKTVNLANQLSAFVASGTKTTYSPSDNGTWIQIALSSPYTVTRGQSLALEIQTSGTWTNAIYNVPYRLRNINGVGQGYPQLSNFEGLPLFMYRSATKAYNTNITGFTLVSPFRPNSAIDEVGMSLKLPAQAGNFTIQGAEIAIGQQNSDNRFDLVLFRVDVPYSSVVELQRVAFSVDWTRGQPYQYILVMFDEATLSTLNYDQEYILSVVSTGSTQQNMNYCYFNVDDNYMSAYSPGTFKFVQRADSGTFTTVPNQMLCVSALIGSTSGATGTAVTQTPQFVIPAWKDTRMRWAGIDFVPTTFSANSSSFNTYFAYIVQAEKTANLTRVAFRQISRTGTANKTVRVGIMNVSTTTGKPDGTWRGYKDFIVGAETNSMIAQTMDTFASGTSVAVTRGDVIAIVVEPRSGFVANSETLTLTTQFGTDSYASVLNEFPYVDISGTKLNGLSVAAYGSASEWYGYPYGQLGEYSHSTQEVGARIKFTNTSLSKVTLRGIRIFTKRNNAWNMDVKIYDSVSATTPIASGTYTHDFDQGWADYTTYAKPMTIMFATSPSLNTNQYYYVVLSRASGLYDQVRQRIEMGTGNAGYLDAINPNWESCWTERPTVGSGTFSSTDTMRPDWDFIFDGVAIPDSQASGGGLIVHPGMTGGMRG